MDSRAMRCRSKVRKLTAALVLTFFLTLSLPAQSPTSISENKRPRARDVGISVGILPVGALNSITDVPGVAVGHSTIIRGENVRTGVTAVLPHQGNLFREKGAGRSLRGQRIWKAHGLDSGKRARRNRNADLADVYT